MNKWMIKFNSYKHSLATRKVADKVSTRVKESSGLVNFTKTLLKATILMLFGFVVIFPFFYMISMSLMTYAETTNPNGTPILPDVPMWSNYWEAFTNGYILVFVFSSLIMITNVLLKVIVTMMLGYAFGNYNFKGKNVLWIFFLATMIIPEVALISGQYTMTIKLGWDTGIGLLLGLSAPYIASVFTAYMFRNAFEAIPNSVKEAAIIDGIEGKSYFFKIAIPMVSSTTWTVIILTAFASWNSYMWPALVLGGSNLNTMTLWLFNVGLPPDGSTMLIQLQMAGAVLTIIPTLIVYLIFKKRINSTVAATGANKG